MRLIDGTYESRRYYGEQGTGFFVQPRKYDRDYGERFFVTWNKLREVLTELNMEKEILEYKFGRKQTWEHVVREIYTACNVVRFRRMNKEMCLMADNDFNIEEVLNKIKKNILININVGNIRKMRRALKSNVLA